MMLEASTRISRICNLCCHTDDHGLPAEWHFSATSLGISRCDGVGGTVKGTGRSEEAEILRNITFSEKILTESCGI